MTTLSDKFEAVAGKLEGFNGLAVTRHPGDGGGVVAVTAFAWVATRVERRHDPVTGGERYVRVGSLRMIRGTVVQDNDTWTINGEADWSTTHVVHLEPSVRLTVELPVDRTGGGPALMDYA